MPLSFTMIKAGDKYCGIQAGTSLLGSWNVGAQLFLYSREECQLLFIERVSQYGVNISDVEALKTLMFLISLGHFMSSL